jgi:autotransporter-associated beta strand protein
MKINPSLRTRSTASFFTFFSARFSVFAVALLSLVPFSSGHAAEWLNETFDQYTVASPETQPTVGNSPFLQASSVATTVASISGGKQVRYSKLTAAAVGNSLQYSLSLNNATARPKGYFSVKITQNSVPSPLVSSSDLNIRLGSNDSTTMSSANSAYIELRFTPSASTCAFSGRSGGTAQTTKVTSVSAATQHTVQVWYTSEGATMPYTDPSGASQTLAANSYVCYVDGVLANPTGAGSTMIASVITNGSTTPSVTSSTIGKISFSAASTKTIDFLIDDIYAADSAPGSGVGITSATTATAQAGYPFSYTITSSGVTSPVYSTSTLPLGLSLLSGVINGPLSTSANQGLNNITLTASGTGGPATGNLALTITAPPVVVPTVNSAATASGNLTKTFTYQITTSTTLPSSTPTSYAIATGDLSTLGLSLNPATGLISGTPTALTPDGGTQITYTATNPFGTSAQQTLTITINPAPVFTWNNTSTTWTNGSSWTNLVAPANSATGDIAAFGNVGSSATSVDVGTGRSIGGIVFNSGAYNYTWTGTDITVGYTGSITNNAAAIQTFNNKVINSSGSATWFSVLGGSLVFNGGIDLTTASSATSRTLTFAGPGNVTVSGAIVNGGTALAGKVTVTATGTTTLTGTNTYDGLTTMSAAGGTLTLSGNNSGAAGGVTLTAGTLNLNSANALGTGTLDLGATTGTSYGSSIINNTSGATLTYLGLSGVTWTGVNPAGIQFGTPASTSTNNMDFGSGLVTAATDRSMNIAGTGVTISMGILTTSGTAGSYTYKIDGAGNTLDLDGWRISGATTPTQPVQHKISGTANVNIGAIENGTGSFANSAVFMSDGTTRLTGNNTYTGTTEFIGSGTTIISGNNSAAVGNVKIAGDTGKTPNVRLDNVNGISSSSSLIGSSGVAQVGTLDLRAAGNFSLNSFGTVSTAGNNMIFTNSSGSQKTLGFTAANNYITTASTGGRTLYNNSANLLVDFDGNIEIGGTSATTEATTFAGVGNFNVDGDLLDTGTGLTRALRKQGDGTLTLRGSANNRGSTLVEGGKLEVVGALSNASSIAVSSGATLKFNQPSGVISVGAMKVAGTLEQELVTITSSGVVDLTGSTLKVNGTPALDSYTLVNGTSVTGTPTLSGADGYQLIVDSTSVKLVKTVAPTGSTFDTTYAAGTEQEVGSNGLSNLMNYSLGGTGPNSSPALPVLTSDANGLTLTANIRNDDASGLNVIGQYAYSLEGPWIDVTPLIATGAISSVEKTTVRSFSRAFEDNQLRVFMRFQTRK